MTPVRLEPAALRSRVKHSTTEPLRSPDKYYKNLHPHIYKLNFQAQLYTALNRLDNLCSYAIFYKVIYVTLIYLTENGNVFSTVIKEPSFYLLSVLNSSTFDKSK